VQVYCLQYFFENLGSNCFQEVGCIWVTDVKNAAYALSIAIVFSTLILSFALVESSKNIGGLSLARTVQAAGGSQPTAIATVVATSTPAPTQAAAATPVPSVLTPKLDLKGWPVMGSATAKVTLVEYTDLQCPFCSRHHTQAYPSIVKDYVDTGKIKYVLKQFPLSSIHQYALNAGIAAACAAKQDNDKAIKFIDKVFSNQDAIDVPDLKKYAVAVSLDATAFGTCLDGKETKAAVDASLQEGVDNGVSGTPSFLVLKPNGEAERIVGAQPFSVFKVSLDKALAA